MMQRLYVHNFRCFENFEFKADKISSALLIGKNGAGKSTMSATLRVLQSIGRGINRAGNLVTPQDFTGGRSAPMTIAVEVLLDGHLYMYSVAFDLPEKFKELRVAEERLELAGKVIYSRDHAQVTLLPKKPDDRTQAKFLVDWHLIALPVIQVQSDKDPVHIFRTWLSRMVILAPIPSLISGDSTEETLEPKTDGSNLADWLSGLLGRSPAAYSTVKDYLQSVMPDIEEFRNEQVGRDAKRMVINFAESTSKLDLNFENLSDGEKCFFICAVVIAANKAYGPLFCFWDEPDNFLSLAEVSHFVMALRKAFQNGGQIIVTSHNGLAIQNFARSNTWVLDRKNHFAPTQIRLLEELEYGPDLLGALTRGEVTI